MRRKRLMYIRYYNVSSMSMVAEKAKVVGMAYVFEAEKRYFVNEIPNGGDAAIMRRAGTLRSSSISDNKRNKYAIINIKLSIKKNGKT